MSVVNFKQGFKDLDGQAINDTDGDVKKLGAILAALKAGVAEEDILKALKELKTPSPLTLQNVAGSALSARFQDEANLDWKESLKRNDLAEKIYRSPETIVLTNDEGTMIQKLIAKLGYNHRVTALACQMLEGQKSE